MSTYPAPDLYTPMIFNQASYKTSSESTLNSYLRKAGGENVTAPETFLGGIKTDTVKDVAGNSLLTKTGLGANIVSSSLTSVGTLGGGTDSLSTANTLLKVARSSRSTDPIASFVASQNTTGGDKTKIDFGINNSSKNSGTLYFLYTGNGSNDNNVCLGFNGGNVLSLNNNGSTMYFPGTCQLGGSYPNQMLQLSTTTDNVYLDFHSKTSGSNSSYDSRISSSGGSSSTSGQADLSLTAKTVIVSGALRVGSTQYVVTNSTSGLTTQYGSHTPLTVDNGTIPYPTAFSSAPTVFCQLDGTTASVYLVTNNVGTANFSWKTNQVIASPWSIKWFAIGPV